jgi:indolepyruvate ferredoxin oxidoreductase beta subunit
MLPSAASLGTPRDPAVRALLDRARRDFGGTPPALVIEGLRRLVDYQDADYAMRYLDRLAPLRAFGDATLLEETARHLALWMSYEDTIRVADLKTRATRFERVRAEVRAEPDQVLAIHDYLHPRLEEIADTLPQRLGRWLLASNAPRRLVQRLVCKGRVVRTSSLRGFALLSLVAAMRRWRRGTLRHAVENERIEDWLGEILRTAPRDLALALEIARCQNLVKGYGDTHERGLRNYATLRSAWQRGDVRLAAGQLADLRAAALADDSGHALQAALQRHALA